METSSRSFATRVLARTPLTSCNMTMPPRSCASPEAMILLTGGSRGLAGRHEERESSPSAPVDDWSTPPRRQGIGCRHGGGLLHLDIPNDAVSARTSRTLSAIHTGNGRKTVGTTAYKRILMAWISPSKQEELLSQSPRTLVAGEDPRRTSSNNVRRESTTTCDHQAGRVLETHGSIFNNILEGNIHFLARSGTSSPSSFGTNNVPGKRLSSIT